MPDNSAKIKALEDALDSGVSQAVIDGETIVFRDADEIRKRLRELWDSHTSRRRRLPAYTPIDLPSAFH